MKTIKGNLLEMFDAGHFDVIVHGCNMQNDMSGGIALQIARLYPEAVEADVNYPVQAKRLGTHSIAYIDRMQYIVNAYTQIYPGADARLVGVTKAFRNLRNVLKGYRVGIPMIGAGIGGLEWSDVELVLDRLDLPNVTVVEFG